MIKAIISDLGRVILDFDHNSVFSIDNYFSLAYITHIRVISCH